MLKYIPAEINYFETLEKNSIILDTQKQFVQEKVSNVATVCRITATMNTNSEFTRSCTRSSFWYQHFDLRQKRKLKKCQPFVAFDATNNCRLIVTTMKPRNFHDHIFTIPTRFSKNHYVLLFDLT